MGREDLEQQALFEWAEYNLFRFPELKWLFSIPMGGYRPVQTAIRMKLTGSKKGVVDIALPVARHNYHGLFIEMKIHPNTPSSEQLEFIEFVTGQGYLAVVCYSAEEAIQTIESYLGMEQAQKDRQKVNSHPGFPCLSFRQLHNRFYYFLPVVDSLK